MIDLILIGDVTDHGGKVINATETMHYGGRRVARKGVAATSPLPPDISKGGAQIPRYGVVHVTMTRGVAVNTARAGQHDSNSEFLTHS